MIGPGHIFAKTPNQDAFIIRKWKDCTLAVVSDGMGSKPYSHIGSKAACESVFESIKIWSRSNCLNIVNLLKLIHNIWLIKIAPLKPDDCSATCLFAFINKENEILIAQLGDGLIAILNNDNLELLTVEKYDDFSNSTTALGVAKTLEEWKYKQFNRFNSDYKLLITTDGISEDLIESKYKDFINYLHNYSYMSSRARKYRLSKMLKNWPTRFHNDDKTLVLLHNQNK